MLIVPFAAVNAQQAAPLMPSDSDRDGIPDKIDNCLLLDNPIQQDSDADGFGTACDPDLNNDLIVDAQDIELFEKLPQTADLRPHLDFNLDGKRDPIDGDILRSWQGKPPGPAAKRTSSGLIPEQLGLVINDNDPVSIEIGEYYRIKRNIPDANIVHVQLPVRAGISRATFAPAKRKIDQELPPYVQAIAIAWTNPHAVECNSITSAISRGFLASGCDNESVAKYCGFSDFNPYFNSYSRLPYSQFGIRPSMLLASSTFEETKALIDRGLSAQATHPKGKAYIMNTSDNIRNERAEVFDHAFLGRAINQNIDIHLISADSISDTNDTFFYFQGMMSIPNLKNKNTYPPGAIIDNLTSSGGMLEHNTGHTKATELIAAGATGAFGAVSEPCVHKEKFANPAVLIAHYTSGQTLVEAYWKSLEQTFQALLVGDPLANPWAKEKTSGYLGSP